MKTFNFIHKDSSAVLTVSADDFINAEEQLEELVKETWNWRIENEKGINEN